MQKLCNRERYCLFKSRYNRSRTLFSFVLAGFCFMLFNLSTAWAQSPENGEAAEGQNGVTPLLVGQKVPEEFWTTQHLWFMDGDTVRQDIANHKNKHVILASWSLDCGPCLMSLPKLDSLQKRFGGNLQIILVNSQTRRNGYERFHDFFTNGHRLLSQKISMPSIVYDTYFQTLFPIRVLPNYIWIKPGGLVKAFLSSEFINEQQIQAVLDRGGANE